MKNKVPFFSNQKNSSAGRLCVALHIHVSFTLSEKEWKKTLNQWPNNQWTAIDQSARWTDPQITGTNTCKQACIPFLWFILNSLKLVGMSQRPVSNELQKGMFAKRVIVLKRVEIEKVRVSPQT
jgi:hypothetical protein